ncbi:MAG: hypothetical protein JWM94_1475 [Sphingomonas bacterium]|nr:hypothetical protein [Sphingomonas bacterium]
MDAKAAVTVPVEQRADYAAMALHWRGIARMAREQDAGRHGMADTQP